MNRRTLIIAVALIIALSYLASQRSISIPVSAEFGYGGNGKYVLFYTDQQRVLEEIRVNNRKYKIIEEPTRKHLFRFNYESGKEYSFYLKFKKAKGRLKAKAPRLEKKLDVKAEFYHTSDGKTVARYDIFSIENDEVVVSLLSGPLPKRLCLLDYPLVLVDKKNYDEFREALKEELRKYSVSLTGVKSPCSCRGDVLVIANGALPPPEELACLKTEKIIYAGVMPGDIYVTQEGAVIPGSSRCVSLKSKSKKSGLGFELEFESSGYFCSSDKVFATREDGKPAVFLLREKNKNLSILVFSNTISQGWKSPEKAARDIAIAAASNLFSPAKIQRFKLGKDAANLSGIIYLDSNTSFSALVVSADQKLVRVIKGVPEPSLIKLETSLHENNLRVRILASPGENTADYMKLLLDEKVVWSKYLTCRKSCLEEAEIEALAGVHLLEASFGKEKGFYLIATPEIRTKAIFATPEKLVLEVTQGGKPYSGEVTLIINGKPVKKEKIEGILTYIPEKKLKEGSVVEVYIPGYRAKIVIKAKSGIPLAWKLIAFCMLFLVLLASMLSIKRFGKPSPIVVEFPVPEVAAKAVEIAPSELVKLFDLYNRKLRRGRLPLKIDEIADAIEAFGIGERPSLKSLQKALKELESAPFDLRIAKHGDYYLPMIWMIGKGGDQTEHYVMLRIVYDYLISHGIPAKVLSGEEEEAMLLREKEKGKEELATRIPDIIAIGRKEAVLSAFPQLGKRGIPSYSHDTIRLFIECETGKRSMERIFKEKMDVLRPYFDRREGEARKRAADAFEVLVIVMSDRTYRDYIAPGMRRKLKELADRIDEMSFDGRLLVLPLSFFRSS